MAAFGYAHARIHSLTRGSNLTAEIAKPTVADIESERNLRATMRLLNREKSEESFWRYMYGKENIESTTDLGKGEDSALSYSIWFARRYNMPWLEDRVNILMDLRRSRKRKGREEAISYMRGDTEQKARGWARLKGAFG